MEDKKITYDLMTFSGETVDYAIISSQEFSDRYLLLISTIKELSDAKKDIDDKLKEVIGKEYYLTGVQTVETDTCKITYIPEGMRENFNLMKFKKDHPDLYREYLEPSKTSPSIRTTVKKKETSEDGK